MYVTPVAGFEVIVVDWVELLQVIVPVDELALTVGWLAEGTTVKTNEEIQPLVGCVEFNV